ncbi:MAG: globin family protein [Verrucomicrobiota bacterium]
MTEDQIKLIQDSWAMVLPIEEAAAELFYSRLFETAPEVKPLFTTDIKEQGAKLMKMITMVVNGLTKLDAIVPAIQALGKRHVDYGVKDEHYAIVGAALIWTLEQGLGEAFTEEVKVAWLAAYTVLSQTMIEAAAAEEQHEDARQSLSRTRTTEGRQVNQNRLREVIGTSRSSEPRRNPYRSMRKP